MRLITSAALLLASAGMAQASTFLADAEITVEIIGISADPDTGTDPSDLDLVEFYALEFSNFTSTTGAGTATATTTTSTVPVTPTFPSSPLIGHSTSLLSKVSGDATAPDFAFAVAFADTGIVIKNTSSSETYTITFSVDYETVAGITTDLADLAGARSAVQINLDTDGELTSAGSLEPAGGTGLFTFVEIAEAFDFGSDADDVGSYNFAVELSAGESLGVFSFADVIGAVNFFAPIPIGPAAPLLLSALGGFGLLRLRAGKMRAS